MRPDSNYLGCIRTENPDMSSQSPDLDCHVDPKSTKPTVYGVSQLGRQESILNKRANSNYLGRHHIEPNVARTSKVLLSVLTKVARTMLLTIPGRWLLYEHS